MINITGEYIVGKVIGEKIMMYERLHKADAEFFKMVDGLKKVQMFHL
ncbi:MAG: hypothetical protein GX220_08695 [Treponema sp.]|nr:hypothetical protein [Treponema sp.]